MPNCCLLAKDDQVMAPRLCPTRVRKTTLYWPTLPPRLWHTDGLAISFARYVCDGPEHISALQRALGGAQCTKEQ